jgi:hypothetical protein
MIPENPFYHYLEAIPRSTLIVHALTGAYMIYSSLPCSILFARDIVRVLS